MEDFKESCRNMRSKGVQAMSDCLFCKIIKGEIPSQVVYENEAVMIFKDIAPVAPTHWLAIPKSHIDNICDPRLVDGELLQSIFAAIQHVSEAEGLSENGFRVIVNYGNDAGEAVPHLHFHLIAGRKLNWPPG